MKFHYGRANCYIQATGEYTKTSDKQHRAFHLLSIFIVYYVVQDFTFRSAKILCWMLFYMNQALLASVKNKSAVTWKQKRFLWLTHPL